MLKTAPDSHLSERIAASPGGQRSAHATQEFLAAVLEVVICYADHAPVLVVDSLPTSDVRAKLEWVVVSGIGGHGHIAVQYAKAMGFRVVIQY